MKQRSAKPTRKVATGGTVAMVAVVLGYLATTLGHIDLPTPVAFALAGLVVGGLAWLAAYLMPASPDDDPIVAPRQRPAKRRARPGSDPMED